MHPLKEIYWGLGRLDAERARGMVGASARTFRRWLTLPIDQIPKAPIRVLELDAAGVMPACAGDFIGQFRFVDGQLVDLATNEAYRAGDIRAIFWLRQAIGILDRERTSRVRKALAIANQLQHPPTKKRKRQ